MTLPLLIPKMVEQGITYIKEDNITVRISVMPVNTIESLRELHIAYFLSWNGVHHEAHGFSESLTSVDIVITVHIQQEWCIWQDCWNSYLWWVGVK